jgi:hypothetical protein
MIGLIGVGLFPVAFALFLIAGALAKTAGTFPFWRIGLGLVVYLIGVLLLLALAGYGSSLAFNLVRGVKDSNLWEWVFLALSSLAPTIIIPIGLRLRSAWSWRRCAVWGVAALSVLPTAVMVFLILAQVLPLTA